MITAQHAPIIIIEDHPLYGEALGSLLTKEFAEHKIIIRHSLENGCSAIEDANRAGERPAVLVDLTLPDVTGVTAAIRIAEQFPDNPMGIISASDDFVQVSTCLNAGARMFISKAASPQEITQAIRSLLDGTPLTLKWITGDGPRKADERMAISLTERQLEVLRLVCVGKSNRDIAAELGIAEITTKAHVSAIFRELRVLNRTQAVLAAQRYGLVSTD